MELSAADGVLPGAFEWVGTELVLGQGLSGFLVTGRRHVVIPVWFYLLPQSSTHLSDLALLLVSFLTHLKLHVWE
jgi:hypothetical protein